MRVHIGIEPSNGAWRTHLLDQVLALEELKSAVNRGLRQTGKLFAQPAVNGFRGGMSQILGQRPVNCQTLRGNTNAPQATLLLEVRAPAFDFIAVSPQELSAVYSHVRIIIIWSRVASSGKLQVDM